MIYASEYSSQEPFSIFDMNKAIGKQSLWIGIAFTLMIITLNIDWKFWRNFAFVLYGIGIVLLIAVLVFGIEVKGARSWFSVFGFTLQPVEFVKFSTCLALSSFLAGPSPKLRHFQNVVISIFIFTLPVILIIIQPDAGSALVFLSFFIVLFREGMSKTPYILGMVGAAIFLLSLVLSPVVVMILMTLAMIGILIYDFDYKIYWYSSLLILLIVSIICVVQGLYLQILIVNSILLLFFLFYQWQGGKLNFVISIMIVMLLCAGLSYGTDYAFNNFLKPHQQERFNVWLFPEKCDPHGPLYNVLLSKIAIGSGGFTGKGYLEGTLTKLDYVPEQSTDFIFCTVGEEQGFIGSVAIITLFVILLLRIITIAERQRLNLFRLYAYGVVGILFFHFIINIGMTMGLVPIIGIPLPFISYGGSSLLGFTLMLGVLLKFDSQRYLN